MTKKTSSAATQFEFDADKLCNLLYLDLSYLSYSLYTCNQVLITPEKNVCTLVYMYKHLNPRCVQNPYLQYLITMVLVSSLWFGVSFSGIVKEMAAWSTSKGTDRT